MKLGVFFAAVLLSLPSIAAAMVYPHEQLRDPHLEQQAVRLGDRLRCVNCEGQTINSSGDELAAAMRADIRARLTQGESIAQIEQAFVRLYGVQILFAPPKTGVHLGLWFLPALLVLPLGWRLMKIRRA